MVMDRASCGSGSITGLHHRMTNEHMVIDLCPDSGPGLDEPAHRDHLSYASLFLTAGKFWGKELTRKFWRKELTNKASGAPTVVLEVIFQALVIDGCQNKDRFFFSPPQSFLVSSWEASRRWSLR